MLKNKNILKIVAIFAVLLMSMYMLTGCEIGKKSSDNKKEENVEQASYEEPIKNLIEGLSEANSEKFLKAFPPYVGEYMEDIFTDEYLKSTLEEAESDYGSNIKMSFEVTNKEEISEEDMKQMEDEVKENFDKQIDITKGYALDVVVTTKGDNSEDKEEDTFNVYEVEGNWYILDL